MVEKPKTEERGVYLNIGYGLSFDRLSPDTWSDKEWESFIDQLVLARATFWSFYLWTEIEHVYPGHSLEWAEKNRKVHEALHHAVQYGHRRGLRAVFLFTPTNIPADMVAANPSWKTTLEYTNNGGICSRVPEAYEAALKVHRHQMEYFKDCDEVDIAFYDCGGCMCEECRKGNVQLGELLKQIRDFSAITWELNPNAHFGFWTWAVWRYEHKHNYSHRNNLIPQAAEILGDRRGRTVVIDSYHGDTGSVPFFEEARKNGFRTSQFTYQTNIEDGYALLLPLMAFQKRWAAKAQENGLDEAFLMTMQAASRMPSCHFGLEFFWDASLSESQVAARYGLQLSGDLKAAASLQRGFLLLERLTFEGAVGADNAVRMAEEARGCFEAAAAEAPRHVDDIRPWLTTAKAYEALFRATDSRDKRDDAGVASHARRISRFSGTIHCFNRLARPMPVACSTNM